MDTNNHGRTTTTTLPNAYVGGNGDADKIAYLIRYETMVRQQEAEDMAVWAHVGPCMVRLMELIHSMEQHPHDHMPSHAPSVVPPHVVLLQEEVSFVQLKLALQALEALSPPPSPGRLEIQHDTTPKAAAVVECMTTDRQLMMILRLLTQKVVLDTDTSSSTSTTTPMIGLTWAEFVQCYKICIIGMITLQHLPIPSQSQSSSSSVTTATSVVRTRARDRTLAMLSLFEFPSTQLFHQLLPLPSEHHDDDDVLAVANNRSNVPANAPVRMTHPRNERNSYRHHNVQYDDTDTSSPTKPRPWFKKRTQRILPYLIVIMVSLVGIVPIWYQRRQLLLSSQHPTRDDTTTTTVVQPSVTRRNRNDLPTTVTTSSLWFLPPTTTTWTSPSSSPPSVVVAGVHDPPAWHTGTTSSSSSLPTLEKQKTHPSRYSVPMMIHPPIASSNIFPKKNPTQYHPLLGIWSNFML
jgi:hypothetical protein